MFLAFRAEGAGDWSSYFRIALVHRGARHAMQFHYIFPRSLLRWQYSNLEINDIANLAFIAGRTNRKLSNQSPSVYSTDVMAKTGVGPFEAQAIPTQPDLVEVEAGPRFFEERRRQVAERPNAFLRLD